jgi:hypothetical protein
MKSNCSPEFTFCLLRLHESVNEPTAIEIVEIPEEFAGGVKVAVYTVEEVALQPVKAPVETATSPEVKSVDGSESVKVMVEVCPSSNIPTPDLVIATVGEIVSNAMASDVNAVLRFSLPSVNVPAAIEIVAEPVEFAGGVNTAVYTVGETAIQSLRTPNEAVTSAATKSSDGSDKVMVRVSGPHTPTVDPAVPEREMDTTLGAMVSQSTSSPARHTSSSPFFA